MEIKPLVIFFCVYLFMIFLFNLLCVNYTQVTGCKEELGSASGLTLRAAVKVKIMLIHYLNNA